jgi:hypothetical protein
MNKIPNVIIRDLREFLGIDCDDATQDIIIFNWDKKTILTNYMLYNNLNIELIPQIELLYQNKIELNNFLNLNFYGNVDELLLISNL